MRWCVRGWPDRGSQGSLEGAGHRWCVYFLASLAVSQCGSLAPTIEMICRGPAAASLSPSCRGQE